MSETAWRTYTHPPTSQGDPEAANTSAWRQEDAREALGRLPQVLTDPHLAQGSHLLVSLNPTEEAGHQVGRVLHAIADPAGDP